MAKAEAEVLLQGIPLSPGVALGSPCILVQPTLRAEDPGPRVTLLEERRLIESLAWMDERLEDLARAAGQRLGPDSAEIFEAHRMLLGDPELRGRLFEAIERDKQRADIAVARHLETYEALLAASPHPYLRERADDIAELRRTLVKRLREGATSLRCELADRCEVGVCPNGRDHVLVAEELTPSLTIEMDEGTVAFVVERGGPTSHAAILARALQVPAVAGIPVSQIPAGAPLLVDGASGRVFVAPSADTVAAFTGQIRRRQTPRSRPPVPGLRVYANIDGPGGLKSAAQAQAEGIGLYRTELDVLREGHLLTEDEQASRYLEVLRAMRGRPSYIRLLDIGADKVADWLDLPPEDNPALGCRGARLLLSRPELLRPQARALVRAAREGVLHVIYPMIVDAAQLRRLRALFEELTADLPPGHLRHGLMFEVPSACLIPEALLEVADFGCVGTNDLVQYLFAADRGLPAAAEEGLSDHPVLWDVLGRISHAARVAGKPLSVCGELAGIPSNIAHLMRVGIDTVSVDPSAIAAVRDAAEAARRR